MSKINIFYSKKRLHGTRCHKYVIFLEWCMVHLLKLLSLASFLYLIAVLIRMIMCRFLIDIYLISLFTSIREEQCLHMEVVYPVYHYIEISSQCNQTVWHVCFISIITTLSMYLGKYNFTTCLPCLNLYMCPTIMCAILSQQFCH
jgi:hypothetical protein